MKKTFLVFGLMLVLSGCSHLGKQNESSGALPKSENSSKEEVIEKENKPVVEGRFVKGEKAPRVVVESFDGKSVDLSEFYGKRAVVIDFWAGWCPFCVNEMPELEKAQNKYGSDLLMVGVHRTDTESVKVGDRFAIERGVTYMLVKDTDGSIYRAAGGIGMPVAIYIDKSGVVREIKSGPKTAEEINEKVELLL